MTPASRKYIVVSALAGVAAGAAVILALSGSLARQNDAIAYLTSTQRDDGSTAVQPTNLTDLLPARQYRMPSGQLIRLSTLVATGRFTKWQEGTAYSFEHPNPEDGSGTATSWGDPNALARTIVATFEVEQVVAHSKESESISKGTTVPVVFYLWGQDDSKRLGAGLLSLGTSLVFLDPSGTGDAYAITENGEMLGSVATDGTFTMLINVTKASGDKSDIGSIQVDATSLSGLAAANVARIVDVQTPEITGGSPTPSDSSTTAMPTPSATEWK